MTYRRRASSAASTSWSTTPASSTWRNGRGLPARDVGRDHRDQPELGLPHHAAGAARRCKQRNWGRIINIASAHGLVASAQKSAYVAAKHGIVGFTKAVALETATTGITVNAICPGWVLTPLVQKQIDDRAAREGIADRARPSAELLRREAAVAAVHHAGAARRAGGVPVLAGRPTTCAAWPGTSTAAGRRSERGVTCVICTVPFTVDRHRAPCRPRPAAPRPAADRRLARASSASAHRPAARWSRR